MVERTDRIIGQITTLSDKVKYPKYIDEIPTVDDNIIPDETLLSELYGIGTYIDGDSDSPIHVFEEALGVDIARHIGKIKRVLRQTDEALINEEYLFKGTEDHFTVGDIRSLDEHHLLGLDNVDRVDVAILKALFNRDEDE